jgi:hypothetical protein
MEEESSSEKQPAMEQQQQSSMPMVMTYQDGVTAVLVSSEELLRACRSLSSSQDDDSTTLTAHHCLEWRHALEGVLHHLWSLRPSDDVERDLLTHCQQRVATLVNTLLEQMVSRSEPTGDDNSIDPDLERDAQAATARVAEVALLLLGDPNQHQKEVDKIIETYVSYQRKVLRQRAKPCISALVARRQLDNPKWIVDDVEEEEEDEEDDDVEELASSSHSHVLTSILGQASSLIHPLLMWKNNLPSDIPLYKLCLDSIAILDEQAQTMSTTVAGWFFEDRNVDDWIAKGAEQESTRQNTSTSRASLAELDAIVEDLAFLCQVVSRYNTLLGGSLPKSSQESSKLFKLAPEWTWKYASLERFLTTQQLQSALDLATPVSIILGTSIQVPSVVEDSQFLSRRALERAASTRSAQAIGTVAHSISADVWSTDMTGGVFQALLDQRGCSPEEVAGSGGKDNKSLSPKQAPKSGDSFASALLGALDEDVKPSKSTPKKIASAPNSGGFLKLSSFGIGGGDKLEDLRIDTMLCALNGMHSASTSCSALVEYLDSLIQPEEGEEAIFDKDEDGKASSMISLTREELNRYAGAYKELLKTQIDSTVREWCGSSSDPSVYKGKCLPVLRYYLERENYDLKDASALHAAEDDVRLHQQYIAPMQQSKLLQNLSKCDSEVLTLLCQSLTSLLVDLILDCIISKTVPKDFTEWGSFLLSRQTRMIQNHVNSLLEHAADDRAAIRTSFPPWEKLSQVVTALQLDKPSDWSDYQDTSVLTPDELQSILELRTSFSKDAIAGVVAYARKTQEKNQS